MGYAWIVKSVSGVVISGCRSLTHAQMVASIATMTGAILLVQRLDPLGTVLFVLIIIGLIQACVGWLGPDIA